MSSQVWPHPLALGQEELVTSLPQLNKAALALKLHIDFLLLSECIVCEGTVHVLKYNDVATEYRPDRVHSTH